MKSEVLRPFLEKALAQWAGLDKVQADPDGDYAFRSGSAEFFVRLSKDDPPVVRLWSVLLKKVKATPRVFRLLNTINSALAFARVYWKDEVIVLTMELSSDSLDTRQVNWACDLIGTIADDLDTKLKEDLGGRMSFADDPDDEDDAVRV